MQKFSRICISVHKFTCLYLCACKWASLVGLYICLCVMSFSVHSLGNVNVNWEMLIVERERQMKRNRDKVVIICAKSTNTICVVATLGVYT